MERATKLSVRLCGERGQSLVEFSVIALILLTVIFGTVEIGRLMLTYEAIADASRAGVRYAITHGHDRLGAGADGPSGPAANPPNVTTVIQNFTTAAGLAAGSLSISVSYPDGNNLVSNRVTVTTSYSYTPVAAFLPFLSGPIGLSSTSQGTICY